MKPLTLRAGILCTLASGRECHLHDIVAAVEAMPVVTEKSQQRWNNRQRMLESEIRAELADMSRHGLVHRVDSATYALAPREQNGRGAAPN